VHRKVACVHKRLEFCVCVQGNRLCTVKSELVHDAKMVVHMVVLWDQYVGACSCLSYFVA
jgi:hypothetical protein